MICKGCGQVELAYPAQNCDECRARPKIDRYAVDVTLPVDEIEMPDPEVGARPSWLTSNADWVAIERARAAKALRADPPPEKRRAGRHTGTLPHHSYGEPVPADFKRRPMPRSVSPLTRLRFMSDIHANPPLRCRECRTDFKSGRELVAHVSTSNCFNDQRGEF